MKIVYYSTLKSISFILGNLLLMESEDWGFNIRMDFYVY